MKRNTKQTAKTGGTLLLAFLIVATAVVTPVAEARYGGEPVAGHDAIYNEANTEQELSNAVIQGTVTSDATIQQTSTPATSFDSTTEFDGINWEKVWSSFGTQTGSDGDGYLTGSGNAIGYFDTATVGTWTATVDVSNSSVAGTDNFHWGFLKGKTGDLSTQAPGYSLIINDNTDGDSEVTAKVVYKDDGQTDHTVISEKVSKGEHTFDIRRSFEDSNSEFELVVDGNTVGISQADTTSVETIEEAEYRSYLTATDGVKVDQLRFAGLEQSSASATFTAGSSVKSGYADLNYTEGTETEIHLLAKNESESSWTSLSTYHFTDHRVEDTREFVKTSDDTDYGKYDKLKVKVSTAGGDVSINRLGLTAEESSGWLGGGSGSPAGVVPAWMFVLLGLGLIALYRRRGDIL